MLHTILFDLDNTLYPKSTGIMLAVRDRIFQYMDKKLGIDPELIPEMRRRLFKKYGTTFIGLKNLYDIDQDEFLSYVHELNLNEFLKHDPALNKLLESFEQRKIIFTNADFNHATRILKFLGVEQFFEDIIDIHILLPYVKPHKDAFETARLHLNLPSWEGCLFIDDTLTNILSAEEIGLSSVHVNEDGPPVVQKSISNIFELPEIINLLIEVP